MYKNEYLESCLEKQEGNVYILKAYSITKRKGFNNLVIEKLEFIYDNKEKLQAFQDELTNAGIKEFILTESSSGLMRILHALNSVNIKIEGVKELKYINQWGKRRNMSRINNENTIKGAIKEIIYAQLSKIFMTKYHDLINNVDFKVSS